MGTIIEYLITKITICGEQHNETYCVWNAKFVILWIQRLYCQINHFGVWGRTAPGGSEMRKWFLETTNRDKNKDELTISQLSYTTDS